MIKWGFDLDGCIVNMIPILLDNIEKEYGYKLEVNDIIKYSIEECTSLSKEQVDRCVSLTIASVDRLLPYSNAIEFLNYYHKITNDPIIFVSARQDKENTIKWLRLHLPELPWEAHFVRGIYKIQPIIRKNIKVFVEDRLKIAIDLARQDIKILLLDRSWNQLDLSNVDNIMRVKDWDEIKDYFDMLRG